MVKLSIGDARGDDEPGRAWRLGGRRPRSRTWRGSPRPPIASATTIMTCSEHIALPAAEIDRRGARYWDPLATFGYLAARTQQHPASRPTCWSLPTTTRSSSPSATARSTWSASGRVILGVGVGTLKEEFDLIGAPYDDRGPRGDDALRALRASLSRARTGLPRRVLRLRGHGRRSVRGAGARPDLGRGAHVALAARGRRHSPRAGARSRWHPLRPRQWLARVELPADFDVVLPPVARLDPIEEPGRTQDILAATAAAGRDHRLGRAAHDTLGEYLDHIEALASVNSVET